MHALVGITTTAVPMHTRAKEVTTVPPAATFIRTTTLFCFEVKQEMFLLWSGRANWELETTISIIILTVHMSGKERLQTCLVVTTGAIRTNIFSKAWKETPEG